MPQIQSEPSPPPLPAREGMPRGWDELGRRLAVESAIFGLLSRAEREVTLQVGLGLSNKEIAVQLQKSPATVKAQVASILHKLEIPTRCRLIVWLHRRNSSRGES